LAEVEVADRETFAKLSLVRFTSFTGTCINLEVDTDYLQNWVIANTNLISQYLIPHFGKNLSELNVERRSGMNAEQAWQSALGQLQMEMPKASFDTWVRDTALISYEDGLFTIGVGNVYARDWLDRRLSSTVNRLLMGMMNRAVEVRFIVADRDDDAESLPESENGNGNDLAVEIVHDTDYSEEVVPDSVVVIDAYLFRLVEQGDIDHNQASLYLGVHQAVWRKWKQGRGEIQNLSWREVSRWAMMSRAVFFKEIAGIPVVKGNTLTSPGQGDGQAMIGLVERVDIEKGRFFRQGNQIRTIANRYRVHMSPRLTRADAAALENRLRSNLGEGEDNNHSRLICILEELSGLPRIADVLAGSEDMQTETPKNPSATTVMEVVRRVGGIDGDLPTPLKAASEKLHSRIINSFGKIYFTQYFIRTVVPALRLTRPQAWLIAWLRDQCYEDKNTGEKRDFVVIDNGIAELARRVGVSADSIWAWLAIDGDDNPATPVSCFVAKMEFDEVPAEFKTRGAVFLKVRMEEPLVSKLLDKNDGKPLRSQYGGKRVARKCANCRKDVHEMHEIFILSRDVRKAVNITKSSVLCVKCAEKRLGRELTPFDFEDVAAKRSRLLSKRVGDFKSPGKLDEKLASQPELETPANRGLRLDRPELETPEPRLETPAYRDLRLIAPKLETPFKLFKLTLNSEEILNTTTRGIAPMAVVVPSAWNLTRLFNINPTNSKVRITLANADPKALISWLLYAISPEGQGIKNPWSWVLSQLRESPNSGAGGPYDILAALPPKELVHLIRYSIEGATGHARTVDEFFARPAESGNKLWDETMGVKNARAGYLLKVLLGYEPDVSVTWEKEITTITYSDQK
jgi:hypothetical protein